MTDEMGVAARGGVNGKILRGRLGDINLLDFYVYVLVS